MLGKEVWILTVLLFGSLLPWAQPVVGQEASRDDVEDFSTEECAVLQLRASLDEVDEAVPGRRVSQGGPSPGAVSQPGPAPTPLPAASSSAAAEPSPPTGESLLRAVAQQSAVALLDASRVQAEHRRVYAELGRARAENAKARAEASRLREETSLLEQKLAAQQVVAGRGPLATSLAFLHQYTWLILAVSAGVVLFALSAYIIYRRCIRSRKRGKKAGTGDLSAPGQVLGSAVGVQVLTGPGDDEDNPGSSYLMSTYNCFCGCSLQTRILFYSCCFLWNLGLAVLWHFGVVQPFLRQLVVFVMIGLAVMAFVILAAVEAWMQLKGRLGTVMVMLEFARRKIDQIMAVLGYKELVMEDSATQLPAKGSQ